MNDDRCDGRCVTAEDLGAPEWTFGIMAQVDDFCSFHGNWSNVMKLLQNVTNYTVSLQEKGKPTVYVSANGPLPADSDHYNWQVYTKRYFGLVQDIKYTSANLDDALDVANKIASGSKEWNV